jgi:hypothetical protein
VVRPLRKGEEHLVPPPCRSSTQFAHHHQCCACSSAKRNSAVLPGAVGSTADNHSLAIVALRAAAPHCLKRVYWQQHHIYPVSNSGVLGCGSVVQVSMSHGYNLPANSYTYALAGISRGLDHQGFTIDSGGTTWSTVTTHIK